MLSNNKRTLSNKVKDKELELNFERPDFIPENLFLYVNKYDFNYLVNKTRDNKIYVNKVCDFLNLALLKNNTNFFIFNGVSKRETLAFNMLIDKHKIAFTKYLSLFDIKEHIFEFSIDRKIMFIKTLEKRRARKKDIPFELFKCFGLDALNIPELIVKYNDYLKDIPVNLIKRLSRKVSYKHITNVLDLIYLKTISLYNSSNRSLEYYSNDNVYSLIVNLIQHNNKYWSTVSNVVDVFFKYKIRHDTKISKNFIRAIHRMNLTDNEIFVMLFTNANLITGVYAMSTSRDNMFTNGHYGIEHNTNIIFKLRNYKAKRKYWKDMIINESFDKNIYAKLLWLKYFQRVPENENVLNLPNKHIIALSKGDNFKWFLKLLKLTQSNKNTIFKINLHEVIAIANITLWFREKSIDVVDYVFTLMNCTLVNNKFIFNSVNLNIVSDIHNLGIHLPNNDLINKENKKFLLTQIYRKDLISSNFINHLKDITRIIDYKDEIYRAGLNYNKSKTKLLKFINGISFRNIQIPELVGECSKWGYTDEQFDILQEHILKRGKPKKEERIADISLEVDNYKIYKITSDNYKGLFLGEYTNCCQHPRSVGSSCAFHGMFSPYGGFYVVEKNGDIVAQSWCWVNEDNIFVFDSIEVLNNNDIKIFTIFKKLAKELKKHYFNYKHICLGSYAGADIYNNKASLSNYKMPKDYSGYSDCGESLYVFQ